MALDQQTTTRLDELTNQVLGRSHGLYNNLQAQYGHLDKEQARALVAEGERVMGTPDFWIEERDLESLKEKAPNVYAWLGNPGIIQAIGERSNLKMLEKVEQDSALGKVAKSFWYGTIDQIRAATSMADAVLDSRVRQEINRARPELDDIAIQVGGSVNYDEFKKESRQEVLKKVVKSDFLKSKYIQADTKLGQVGLDLIRQIPQLVGQGAATVAGGPALGAAYMFATIAGEQYQNLVDDGVDPDRALQAAVGNAAVQSALEQVAFDRVFKGVKVGAKDGLKKIAAKESLIGSGAEFSTEFVQQFPEVFAEYWAKNPDASFVEIIKMMDDNREEILNEAVYAGLLGGIMGGLGGGIKVAFAKRAHNEQVKLVKSTQEEIGNSELMKNNPDVAEQAVRASRGEGSYYIDPDALMSYQQSDPDIFDKLGIDEQSVLKAQENNELVTVDDAKFDVASARENHLIMQSLENDIAFEEDGYTYNQLKAKSAEDIINAQKEAQSESRAMNVELGKFKEQLLASGLDEQQAKSSTVLLSKMATQLSEGSGLSVSQWIKENAPQITREQTMVGGLYGQQTLGSESLKMDMDAWGKEVDSFLSNSKANKNPAKVVTTPLVMTLAGAEIKPIYIDKSVMRKILIEKHSQEMTPEIVKQIPKAITDPLFIYQAQDKGGKKVLVSVLGLKDANGDYVIAPLILDAQVGRYVANKLQTSYGKEAILKPNSKWVESILNSQDLRYINKKETTSWLATLGLQLPTVTSQYSGLSDTSISNENDLVKRKLLYPELYQSSARNQTDTIERQAVYGKYQSTDQWLKAPNGEQSKLSEKDWVTVRTDSFKKWFGDWENDPQKSSKVVDENGEPLVVYHGSPNSFDTFSYEHAGKNGQSRGYGFYFTDSKELAESYLKKEDSETATMFEAFLNIRNSFSETKKTITRNQTKKAIELFSKMEKEQVGEMEYLSNWGDIYREPISRVLETATEAEFGSSKNDVEIISGIINAAGQKLGVYQAFMEATKKDGIITKLDGQDEKTSIYVAAFPEQIKSTENTGAFNPSNPNIYNQSPLNTKGSIFWDEQGRAIIKLFEKGDVSTVVHEMMGHWVTQILIESPNNQNSPQWMLDGRKAILEFAGHTEESFAVAQEDAKNGKYDQMRDLHEKMARAAEAYMMEGKAPNKELKGVFQRFKKWMSAIYQSIKSLDVEITPEIRQLFDRVLTSEQEIQEARAVDGWNDKLPPELIAELPEHRIKELEKFTDQARARAEETFLKKLTSFISQDNKIAMQERRTSLADEIMQDVSQEQTYIAANSIAAEFKNHYKAAKEVAAKYTSGKLAEDQAVHFDVLAELHGYESGAEMAHDITKSPTAERMVQELINITMKREFKDIYGNKAVMESEAQKALYNDDGAMVNAIEAQMIRDKIESMRKQNQTAEERRQEQRVMAERARLTAWSDLNSMSVKDAMKTSVFITAERKAYGKVMQALAKGDFESALKHKETQMYNHAKVMASTEIRRQYESFNRYMEKQRKVDKKTFVNEDNFAQAADIMLKYGYVRTDYSPKMKVQSLADYAKNINENGLGTMAIAEWLYAENAAFDHKQLTLRELKDVQNAIKNIKVYARQANELTRIANGQKLDDLVQDMAVSLIDKEALPEGKRYFDAQQKKGAELSNKEKLGELFRRAHLANVKFADFVLALDNYHDFGLFYNTLYKPLYEGQNQLSNLANDFVGKEKALFEKLYPDKESRKALDQKVYYEEIGTTVDRRYLIEFASHLGSDSNRNVLFGKAPIGLEKSTLWIEGDKEQTGRNIMKFLQKHLAANDWRYVQGSWENVSFLFPLAQEVHKRQTGFYMEQVQKVPFIVNTADGQQIVMRGGYYPLKEDYRASQRAEQNDQKPLYTEGFAMWMPTTNKGYTNSRTGATYSIDLRNTNRYKHIQSVAHDIAFREIIGDMRKLLNNNQFRELIIRKTGKRGEDLIREMVATAAVNRDARTEIGESMMNDFSSYMRKQTVLALLMGNLKTLTQNFANIALYGNAVQGFSHADAIGALFRYGQFDAYTGFKGFRDMVSEVSQKSAFMRDRETAPDYSLNQFVGDEDSKWIQWGGMMLAATDNMTAVPVWKGAYEKAKLMGKTEADSILFADTIIERSIGSGRAIDTASVFRGSPLMKTLTALGSFMNTRYNEWARMYGIAQRDGIVSMQMAAFVFSRILVFKALETILIAGWPKDDEDKEKWAKQWATDAILFPLSTPVGGGATTQAISSLINGTLYQYRPSPVITIGEKLYRFGATGKGFAEGKRSGAELVEAGMGALAFTGIPVLNTPAQMLTKGYPDILNKWFWNAYDIANGMDAEFQDLFKRRPKRER